MRWLRPLMVALGAAALLAALIVAVLGGRAMGRAEVKAEWAAEREAQAAINMKITQGFRQIELAMGRQAAAFNQERADAISAINTSHVQLLGSLRQRASRDHPTTPAVGTDGQAARGNTGSELYREDAEFLAGEAARADLIRVSLNTCYKQYDTALDALAGAAHGATTRTADH